MSQVAGAAFVLVPDKPRGYPGGRHYTFAGARGKTSWPMDGGQGLAAVGMWNFLWRLGFHPRYVSQQSLASIGEDAVLFADLSGDSLQPLIERLRQWVDDDRALVLTGDPQSCSAVIDSAAQWEQVYVEHPYSGVAYIADRRTPALIAPSGWSFTRVQRTGEGVTRLGVIATVGGERQTPHRATLTPAHEAPAILMRRKACFLNATPFAAFQAWLQGQEDLLPWLAWRHRLLWLDEWVSEVADLLSSIGVLDLTASRPGIEGVGDRTVVFRHDVDHSRDTAYLDEEERRDLPATHAILLDRSTKFWVNRVASGRHQESAFHYNTGRRDWIMAGLSKIRGRQADTLRPDVAAVAGTGLLRQVRRAKTAGIGIATIHRHLAFLPYPEWVDALDALLASEPTVLGGSSLFRAQVLRWGRLWLDGRTATVGDWPDSQFPLWLPFRIANAADGGRALRCWESTSLMEPEPELVASLLGSRTPHLRQRVVTVGFHPAHANGSTFAKKGSRESFVRLLDDLRGSDVNILTLRSVYELANRSVSETAAHTPSENVAV
jgi:hypothetical protein